MSSTRNTYIAVIDDEESICRSFGRFLRAAGYQPITYLSAEAFLEDLKHPKFDLLVLDIQLGGMSGLELRNRLAASGSLTPVIFITAHDDTEARTQALASGCAGYFRKADSGNIILDAIRRAVASSASTPDQPTAQGGAS